MKVAWKASSSFRRTLFFILFVFLCVSEVCYGQDYEEEKPKKKPKLKELDTCNGIFLTYTFQGRTKEFPHFKNVTKQAWAFKAEASLTNVGEDELKGWQMYVGFQHREILVTSTGAVLIDGGDFPWPVGNGTTFVGNTVMDLKTAIDTAGDFDQMSARIEMTGTQFGLKAGTNPMPKNIKLVNDGYKCPASTRRGTTMFVCCTKDPKAKVTKGKTKYPPRRNGDVTIAYDVLQANKNNYYAQVTIDNNNPLGRLDHWNLTWEWQGGEFINSMKGAFTHKRDTTTCLFGPAGKFYGDFDFSQAVSCEKKPVLSDLPPQMKEDEKVGKLPGCCRNGSVLPPTMDPNKARSMFQLSVFKMPPDNNLRTALTPPVNWKIDGVLNPQYKCGPPIRVDPAEFPDPSGISDAVSLAIASWQVVCNITKPKPKQNRCCVSFSAFYNESVIPCNTCACGGCEDTKSCDPMGPALLLPSQALLVPFANRTDKARAWANLKHFKVPKKLPCGDNCPVSINWHINSDSKGGWTARMTIFNWKEYNFDDWFAAVSFKRVYNNYENVYSFNGTKIDNLRTIFFQGLKDMNYLVGQTNGSKPYDPKVPGKQQSVISFNKKNINNFDVRKDGFPSKVYFNGEECSLPTHTPIQGSSGNLRASMLAVIVMAFVTFLLMADHSFY